MEPRIAERFLAEGLGLKEGESLLIVSDPGHSALARVLQDAAARAGVRATLASLPAAGALPEFVRGALRDADAAVGLGIPLRESKAARVAEITGHNGGLAATVDGRPLPADLLPVPPPELPAAEIHRLMFVHSNDAQYVLDAESSRFLDVNPAFETLTGYTRSEVIAGALTASRLVALESVGTFQQKMEARKQTPADRYDLKILCKNGDKRSVELSVRRVHVGGRELVLGSVRDLTNRKKLEQQMWEKIEELGFANNRILALTEKLKRVPDLATRLLHVGDEEELLERASDLLCSREGLGYAAVTFHLIKGDALEATYSTVRLRKRRIALSSDHRLTRIARGEDPGQTGNREAVLPLRGRDAILGVFEVSFHPKEIEVLQGSPHALKGYQDLLQTLSSVIGLRIENLQLYERVRIQSIVDQITGAFNRRYFDQKIVEEVHRARRYARDLSLLMIDLDHFGQINKTYGHQVGDMILSETAGIFKAHSRDVDIICRYGGDEFAILMPETAYEHAIAKAEKLRQEVRGHVYPNIVNPSKPVKMSLSIGVTALTPEMKSHEDFLRVADEGLLESKRGGRDAVTGRRSKS